MATIFDTPSGRPLRETEDLDSDYARVITERQLMTERLAAKAARDAAAMQAVAVGADEDALAGETADRAQARKVASDPTRATRGAMQGAGPAAPASADQAAVDAESQDRSTLANLFFYGPVDGVIRAGRATANTAFEAAGAGLKAVGQENLAGVVEGAVDKKEVSITPEANKQDTSYLIGRIGGQAAASYAVGVGALRYAGLLRPGWVQSMLGDGLGGAIAWDPEEEHLANSLHEVAAMTANQNPEDQRFLAEVGRVLTHGGASTGAFLLSPFAAEDDDGPITSRLKLFGENAVAGVFIDRAIEVAKIGIKKRELVTGLLRNRRIARMSASTDAAINQGEEALLETNNTASRLLVQRAKLSDMLEARRIAREAASSPVTVAHEVLENALERARAAGGTVSSAALREQGGVQKEVLDLIEAAEFRSGASGETMEQSLDMLGRGLETPADAIRRVDPELAQRMDGIIGPGGSLDEAIDDAANAVLLGERSFNDALSTLPKEDALEFAKLIDGTRKMHPDVDAMTRVTVAERQAMLKSAPKAADDVAREGAAEGVGAGAPLAKPSPATLSGAYRSLTTAASRLGLADLLTDTAKMESVAKKLYDNTNPDYIDSADIRKGLGAVTQILGDQAAANSKQTFTEVTEGALKLLEDAVSKDGGTVDGMQKLLAQLMPNVDTATALTSLRFYEQTLMDQATDLAHLAKMGSPIDQARFIRTVDMLGQLNEARRGVSRMSGRALNAHKIIKRAFSKSSERARNVAMKDLDSLINNLGGDQALREAATNFQKLAVNGHEAISAYAKMGPTRMFGEMAVEYFINSVLSGPITHAVNLSSNTLASVWLPSERLMWGAVRMPTRAGRADMVEALKMYRGIVAGFESQLNLVATAAQMGRGVGAMFRGEFQQAGGNFRQAMHTIAESNVGRAVRSGESQLLEETGGAGAELLSRGRAISSTNLSSKNIINRHGALRKSFDFFGAVTSIPSRLLMGGDELAKGMNYYAKLNGTAFYEASKRGLTGVAADQFQIDFKRAVALRNGLSREELVEATTRFGKANPMETAEWLDNSFYDSSDYAEYASFAEALQRGSSIEKFNQWSRSNPILRFAVPFVRTPWNIFKFSFERIPGVGMISQLGQQQREILKRGGREAAVVWQRQLGGLTLAGGGAMLAANGLLTGSGPRNQEERDALMATGWKPHSIVWTDGEGKKNYVSISRLEPIGFSLTLAADLWEITTSGDMAEEQAMDFGMAALVAFADLAKSRTFVTGLSLAIDAVRDPNRGLPNLTERIAGGFMPNILTQVAREASGDRSLYDVTAYDSSMETLSGLELVFKAMAAKLPVMGIPGALGIVPRRNIFGEVVTFPSGFGPDILSPFYLGENVEDPISKKVAELADAGEGMRIDMRSFGSITVGDEKIPLTAEEADEWVRLTASAENWAGRGGNMREDLNSIVEGGELDHLSTGGVNMGTAGQVEKLSEFILERKKRAKEMLLLNHPDLAERVLALDQGQEYAKTQDGQGTLDEFFKALGVADPRIRR